MGRALGFIGLLLVVGVGFYLYTRQAESISQGPAGNPRATIDVAGVRQELLALAQAERRYLALEGRYASLDELRSAGEITMASNRRGPYSYSAEVTGSGFRIVATFSGPPEAGVPRSLVIDESMQIRSDAP
ncbi:MAG: hypothetical protein ACRD2R_04595 [Terriglobales bacterium]